MALWRQTVETAPLEAFGISQYYGQSVLHVALEIWWDEHSDWGSGEDMVQLILRRCPQSDTFLDHSGRLPLHIEPSSRDVALVLFQRYPEAAIVQDGKGVTPLCYLLRRFWLPEILDRYPQLATICDNEGVYLWKYALYGIMSDYECAASIETLFRLCPESLIRGTPRSFDLADAC